MSRDLGKGRRNGEGSWIGTREENGNPELVPGISLIVSIPLVNIWSCIPQSFLAAQVQLSIVSEFPREGFVNPREPDPRPLRAPGQEHPGHRSFQILISLHSQKPVGLHWVCLSSEIQTPRIPDFSQDARSVVMGLLDLGSGPT